MAELNDNSTPFDNFKPDAVAPTASQTTAVVEPERERGVWGRILLLALFVALLLGGMGGYVYYHREKWRWERIPMNTPIAQVPKEWTVEQLAERLRDNGRVRDMDAFLEAADEVKLKRIEPGGYLLPREANPRDLAQLFSGGPQLLKITFPEGWTAGQIAKRLESNEFKGGAELRQIAYPPGTVVSPLEGKLFPDTYYLSPEASGKEVAEQLKGRFKEVVENLPKPFPQGADGKPLTLDEVVVLASLVEREAATPDERPLIAGVLLNRLQKGMRLQCDATVQYARRRAAEAGALEGEGHKERLLYRDLVIDSPYNTYQHAGLPPGPICSPGADSLKAAAEPEKSEYFFYVMSPRMGRHRFAKTFEEHKKNIALARQEK